MDLERPIALGRNAEIYDWEGGQVLKLFRQGMPLQEAEAEERIARAVAAAGLSVPRVGGLLIVNGRFGLLFERMAGETLLQQLGRQPWKMMQSARLLAELHAEMHTREVPELPSLKQRLERRVRAAPGLQPSQKVALLVRLQELPDGEHLCHGDFHPDNIILAGRGPVIIDWADATRGRPAADLARSSLLLKAGGLPPGVRMGWLIMLLRGWLHRLYLKRYFEICPGERLEYAAWLPLVAAARLQENVPGERRILLNWIERGIG